jgi:integrase
VHFYRKAVKDAGIEDLTFHDLRHEATSRLFERGVFTEKEVAEFTGHKTPAMLWRYTHLRAEDLAKKMD